jgi:hypothetical protein
MRAPQEPDIDQVEMLPLTIVTQEFAARPSALPDVRDFVRRQLTTTPMSDDEVRTLCDRVAEVLLDAAGESDMLQVSLRIFPAGAEVDVVFSRSRGGPPPPRSEPESAGRERGRGVSSRDRGLGGQDRGLGGQDRGLGGQDRGLGSPAEGAGFRIEHGRQAEPRRPEPPPADGGLSFARWLAAGLRREGLTTEAAARLLNVSTKTVSRWVGGATEPRLRDLYRIRQVFGEPPLQ